ncbi:hypothetical protein AD998_21865 [bacterium 336/3]|nr:hypothetical protein AD998_21865 [bacterium 336/3]
MFFFALPVFCPNFVTSFSLNNNLLNAQMGNDKVDQNKENQGANFDQFKVNPEEAKEIKDEFFRKYIFCF